MALHMHGDGSWQVPSGTALRAQGHGNGDQKLPIGGRHGSSSRYAEDLSDSAMKSNRAKRLNRTTRSRSRGIGLFVCLLLCVVCVTILGGDYLFSSGHNHKGEHGSFRSHDFFDRQDHSGMFSFWNQGTKRNGERGNTNQEGDFDDGDWNNPDKRKGSLQFGNAFNGNEQLLDRDSRDWDKDDRERYKYLGYDTEDLETRNSEDSELDSVIKFDRRRQDTDKEADTDFMKDGKLGNADSFKKLYDANRGSQHGRTQGDTVKLPSRNGGLYNERGRKELRMYEEQLEAALKQELDSASKEQALDLEGSHGQVGKDIVNNKGNGEASTSTTIDTRNKRVYEEVDGYDEYDDGGDEDESLDESVIDVEENSSLKSEIQMEDSLELSHQEGLLNDSGAVGGTEDFLEKKATNILNGMYAQRGTKKGRSQSLQRRNGVQRRLVRKAGRHRGAGYSCPIDFQENTRSLNEPELDFKFANFSLKYIEAEDFQGVTDWKPRFAGHQTLKEREQSFIATDQSIHCGFVQGSGSSETTGFDLAEEDVKFLRTCKIAVSSCIFGSSDDIRSPRGNKLTGSFKKEVCFVMFVDQHTLDVIRQEGQELDERGYVGLWRVVVVRNMPYSDARRIGKIPKFLSHRLFPAARYSLWLDSKLRLQSDPVLILENYLWRGGYEYAISNHYDRHCVWEEVQQNKKLNKYNHSVIDEQFSFYRADGLIRFNSSDPNRLLPSYVPEGSFIIRAHTPMSNLFSCLWFNEVDRFTPRDQLSFAYTYMKLVRTNPDKHFYLNMFKDCERKAMAKLFRHRGNVSNIIQSQLQ